LPPCFPEPAVRGRRFWATAAWRWCSPALATAAAAECHARSRAELPYDGWRLSRGEPAVPTKTVDIFEGDD